MNDKILQDDLDDFLKSTFEGHTIVPAGELWAKIEPQITLNVVPHAKYVRMKYAFIAAAASFVAVVFLLIAQNTSILNPTNHSNSSIVTNSGLISPLDAELKNQSDKSNTSEKKTTSSESKNTSSESSNKLKINTNLANNSSHRAPVPTDECKDLQLISRSETYAQEPILIVEIDPIECPELISGEDHTSVSIMAMTKRPIPRSGMTKAARPATGKSSWSIKFPKIDFGSLTLSGRKPLNRLYGDRNNGIFDLSEFLKKIEVGFNYSPLLSSRTLGKNPITENGNIDRQYFNDIEKALLTNNLGLDLLYRANDQWSFRTGFYFTQYRHETQNDALHRDVISPEQLVLNTSAGKIPVYGSGMNQLPPLSVFNARINLSYLEIPLIARYYWDRHFFTDAGMNYAYLRSAKTNITTEDYTGTISYSGVEGLRNHAFAVSLGLGLDYKLKSRVKFEIGPEVKWQVNSFASVGMNTHPLYWGIRAGIRFKWRNPGYRN